MSVGRCPPRRRLMAGLMLLLTCTVQNTHGWSHGHYWADRIREARSANLDTHQTTTDSSHDQVTYHGSEEGLDPDGDPNSTSGITITEERHHKKHHPHGANDGEYTYCVERAPLHESHGIHVASWRWDEVRPYYAITLFIVIAGLAKLGFHHAHFLSSRVPESCLLILLGTIMGTLTYHFRHLPESDPTDRAWGKALSPTTHVEKFPDIHLPSGPLIGACQTERSAFLPNFDSHLFFLVLLPPIILEAAYSLHDRTFADNLGTILLYAVVGTLFNMFTIGPLLYLLAKVGAMGTSMVPALAGYDISNISFVQMLTFSSLIVAVDPVAVLAIFQEVGVNKDLYFLVFGESLLNDAVTVVLYNAMVALAGQELESVSYDQLLLAVAAFFCVSLGGLAIGIVFGVITALITKHTSELPVVEPLSILALSYLAYLTAELVHFSGIIATVGCGIVQAHYATKNISKNSYITIKYFVSMASSTSDTIIFMFLGMVLISDEHQWHTGFCLWTLVLCLVFRFIGVYLLTWFANRNRMNRIGRKEQFIMAYGGLRGAVGFSLVVMLEDVIDKQTAQVFVTCTMFIVLFTVFVQGSTVKVLVNFFGIKLDEDEEKTLAEEIVGSSFDHIAEGMEEIVGYGGLNRLKERLETLDEKYLTPWLVHTAPMSNLARLYDKLVLDEHYANLYGPAAVLETQKDFDAMSIGSSLPSYANYKDKDRKNSLAPDDGHLDLEPGWMRRKSILHSPNGDIKRRLSSAVNLPLPEDELAWLHRISAATPELPVARPSLSDARRPSIMGDGRRPSLIPPDGLGLSLGRRSSTLPSDGRTGSLQPPPLPGTGGRRTSIVNDMKQGFARRLSVFGATVQDQKDQQDEESGGRRDSVFIRSPSPQTDTQILRHAIRDNPFNKLHFRYNPNLVDEEDQEVESHLRRRRMNARRMSQMVFLPPTAQTMLAGLAEQGESSVPGSESLSRASTRRQSLRIRRSLRETPPVRSRSNSLQPAQFQQGNIPFVFGPKITKARGTTTPESGSTASPEPARASPVAGGHVNPTFVITEESDFESEPAGRHSGTATPPSPSPPESEGSSRRSTSTMRRSSEESCSSNEAAPAAKDAGRPSEEASRTIRSTNRPSEGATRATEGASRMSETGRTSEGSRGPPPGQSVPLVQLPTISITADNNAESESADDQEDVTISKL